MCAVSPGGVETRGGKCGGGMCGTQTPATCTRCHLAVLKQRGWVVVVCVFGGGMAGVEHAYLSHAR
eukprot:364845-Chlamydomonas_euryale.AAC.5